MATSRAPAAASSDDADAGSALGPVRRAVYKDARGRFAKAPAAESEPADAEPSPAEVEPTAPDATPTSAPPAAPAKRARSKPKSKRDVKPTPIAVVLKLFGTIDCELTKLEEHLGQESQDRERASRALSQMASSLEKAIKMQRNVKKASKKAMKPSETEALRHAETLRSQIAERLERIVEQGNVGKPSR